MAACGTAVTATAATAAPAPGDSSAAEKYWTADRMAAAQPVDAQRGTVPPSGLARSRRAAAGAPAGTPKGTFGDGLPMVGTFFFKDVAGDTSCTASVVRSGGRDLILTAAHCIKNKDLSKKAYPIFVPQFRKGKSAAQQPFGVFPVGGKKFIDPGYKTANGTGQDSNLDFAFLRVGPNRQGKKAEDAVGGLRLTNTPRMTNTVTVVGYPNKRYNPTQRAVSCSTGTSQLPGYRQLRLQCENLFDGVSGGPWIMNYDARKRTGDVIGIVGGSGGGGNVHWISYSPVFDQSIQRLYADAVNGRDPVGGGLATQVAPALPEQAKYMRSARFLVAGDYTGDGREDLLVVWKDGEATLYPGNGSGGFGAGRRIADQHSPLERALSVTGGNFTGGTGDLVVLWGDDKGRNTGKLSLFADVSKGVFTSSREYVLGRAGSMWKDAVKLTGGGFNTAGNPTDLAAVWRDGEVTLHSGVSASGTGKERTLAKKGSGWQGVTAITAGRFSGRTGEDLIARWPDGQLQACAGTDCDPKARTTVQAGSSSTKDGSVMVAGDFSASGRRDDLVVRWSNGETSLYDRSTARALGIWNPLVAP